LETLCELDIGIESLKDSQKDDEVERMLFKSAWDWYIYYEYGDCAKLKYDSNPLVYVIYLQA